MKNLDTSMVRRRIIQFGWIVPVVFYIATMARTVGYVDAALVLNNAYFVRLGAWVNNHNLFSVLGWVWMKIVPLGTEFFRLNLLSSLCGAFTVYFVFRACLEYTGSLWASLIAAVAMMISHSLWWHSTMLEVYTLNTLLLALVVFSIASYYSGGRKRWLYAALFFWGLGISNHVLMGLLALAFLVFVIAERKNLTVADVAIGLACLALGLTVFIIAFAKSYRLSHSVLEVLQLATGGNFRSLMFSGESSLFWRLNYLGMLIYQYPSLVLVYMAVGLFYLVAQHRRLDMIILAAIIPLALWSANYLVWDMYAFSLPVYVLLAFPLARGLVALKHRKVLRAIAVATMVFPLVIYPTLGNTRILREYASQYDMNKRVVDAFNPADYFLNPVKAGFNDVDSQIQRLFDQLPQGAWYFDNVYDYPVRYYYQEIRGERPDLTCPPVFAFWVTEAETTRTARTINSLLERGSPVFTDRFVFETIQAKLVYSRTEPVRIGEQVLYRVY